MMGRVITSARLKGPEGRRGEARRREGGPVMPALISSHETGERR
jgi:hypothetical protein